MNKFHIALVAFSLSCVTIQAESLLREFENVKSEVAGSIKNEVAAVKSDWDQIIDYLDKSLFHAKTLRAAHASLEQHSQTAKKVQDTLGKKASGKTKAKINAYKSQADRSDDKSDTQRRQLKNLGENLHKHIDKAVKDAKEGHEKTVHAHNDAQKAVAQHDKEKLEKKMRKENKKKHKQKKDKKEAAKKEADKKADKPKQEVKKKESTEKSKKADASKVSKDKKDEKKK